MDLPRRLSADDILARSILDHGSIIILLDGAEVGRVISYDVDSGTVERLITDCEGKIVVNPGEDELRRETLTGTVEVRFEPYPKPFPVMGIPTSAAVSSVGEA